MNRKRIVIIVGALVIVAVAITALYSFTRSKVLVTSGTVEARNIHVGSKVGGRVEKVLVREGDRVEPGQVLVTFEDQELTAALETAKAQVEQAQANYEMLKRGYRQEDIAEARAAEQQAKSSLDAYERGYRTEQVAQMQANRDRARAEAINAERLYQRAKQLAADGVFSRQQLDDATAARDSAQAALQAAEQQSTEYASGYRKEDVAGARAKYEQASAARKRAERGYRPEEVEQAKASYDSAKAALLDAETRYRERQVIAPSAANVEVLDLRPGDLIAPNTPIALLLERNQIYVRVYVPETKFGRIKLGDKADISVDSFPDRKFSGVVEQINQQAEFLPRNVQTREERSHQVVGVKLRIDDPESLIRAGMSADVRLHTTED